jgi:lipopolysaccharide export system protein LptA
VARLLTAVAVLWCAPALAGPVELPDPSAVAPIEIRADAARKWSLDEQTEVWLLQGGVQVRQGETVGTAREGVLFVQRHAASYYIQAHLEGDVEIVREKEGQAARLTDHDWFGTFQTIDDLKITTPPPGPEPKDKPQVYGTAMMRRNAYREGVVKQAQFTQPAGPATRGDPAAAAEPLPTPAAGQRRLQAWPRSSTPVQATWFPSEDRTEWIAIVDSGINLLISGVELPQAGLQGAGLDTIDISTDRLVIWTAGEELDLSGRSSQQADRPLEIYMEGNVVFRQGQRVLYCDRMYYDVTRKVGVILQAEVLSPVQNYQGLVRLKADVVRQVGPDQFVASNAFVTTSMFGVPGYRLGGDTIYFEDRQSPVVSQVTGEPLVDPFTGEPLIEHERLASSYGNVIRVEEVPVFYWPYFAANLERPEFYIRRASYRNDSVFGHQILTDWDPYQILGISNPPEGTDWTLSVDYLSERGLGHGTRFAYNRVDDWFGVPGAYAGVVDYWGILDNGEDNLGRGRRALVPEEDYRFRLFGRHRMDLADDWQLTGELGFISDRNLLEQYFEREWDEFKDMTTGLELKRLQGNMSYDISADLRINEFFTDTSQVRGNHFWLGQSLLGDRLTYFEHTDVGFARLRTATTPTDPADAAAFAFLPWEADREGERLISTHELDFPFQAGPFKIVLNAMGQAAHWGDDLMGSELDRLYGKAGARVSLPVSAIYPEVESDLLNLHGMAHKVSFELDGSFADATEDATLLPLYDPLDDNAQEHFRRRFAFNTFGGMTPIQFDERFYAIRSGLGDDVTSPAAELFDDLARIRLSAHQRFQTQRGFPHDRRIVDYVVLDTGISFFPNDDRDNFGEDFGLLDYDFAWHVGDRTTITSQGLFDFFDRGQELVRIGATVNRPDRGQIYVGFRSLQGPIDSQVALLSFSYRMSHKWYSTFSTGYDFGEDRNTGQNVGISRIGESFLINFRFNVDDSRDNVGVAFTVTPRFFPLSRAGYFGGGPSVGPAGMFGLE